MPNFTSGKWFEDGDCVFTFDDDDNHSFMIADVNGETREELEANSRLIASAPDMYRLLSFFVEGEAVDEDRFDEYLLAVNETKELLSRIDKIEVKP